MKTNGLIVVTGGTGGLGRRVVVRLRDQGRNVRVLSRHPGDSQAGVEYTAGDLETNQGVEEAVSGAEIVLHCARGGKVKEGTAQAPDPGLAAEAGRGGSHPGGISGVGSGKHT